MPYNYYYYYQYKIINVIKFYLCFLSYILLLAQGFILFHIILFCFTISHIALYLEFVCFNISSNLNKYLYIHDKCLRAMLLNRALCE